VWCGFTDPNLGRVHIEVENDPSYERLATALQCWADCLGTVAMTLQELKQKIDYETRPVQPISKPSETPQTPENLAQWTALRDALGAFDRRYEGRGLDVNRLGYTLREYRNRIIGGLRFTSHEGATGHHARAWYVSTVSPKKEGT
jgi:hypothetical protein